VTAPADVDLAALERYLVARGIRPAGPLSAELIAGGRSNLTYAVSDGASRWVLRRPPSAGLTASAHDMGREFRVTSALHPTSVPVARPLVLCDDPSVLGAPFTVVDWVQGAVVRDRSDLDSLSDDQVQGTAVALIEVLAGLHAVNPHAVGLGDYGRPEGFLARHVALWRRQWDRTRTRELPDLERLHLRLADRVPASSEAAVVHGDYRIDNVILDRDDPRNILAVVDWELSTLGDPLTDVALMCVYRHRALDVILGLPAAWSSPRLPSPEALAQLYSRLSRRDLGDWSFYLGLAHLKLAVIAEGISHRARAGAGAGPQAERAAEAVPELVAAGLEALR
jgi:aminoglycoside phosphotransferase (APT) family kinase protein